MHQINQQVDLADWLIGEVQRLVEEGARDVTWLVNAISGTHDINGAAGEKEEWSRDIKMENENERGHDRPPPIHCSQCRVNASKTP